MAEQEKTSQDTDSGTVVTPSPSPAAAAGEEYVLTGVRLAVVFGAILLSSSLHALDQTILSTALPKIASDFDAFSLQGWISDAYLLATTVLLLVYGKLLRIFPAKWVLVAGISCFEIGSLVAGVSRNVGALIAGRVISGGGAAGIYVSMIQVVSQSTRYEDRPRLFGIFGLVFALCSIIGPLIGGALSDDVTWRWCFYLNLPIGGTSLLVVLLFLHAVPPLGSDPAQRTPRARIQQVLQMDLVGAVLQAAAVTTLTMALQWGGNIKPWGSAGVIACFVVSGVTAIAFLLWEHRQGDNALVPFSIFQSRTVYGSVVVNLCMRFGLIVYSYYIPIFYQAARHSSAIRSGIDLLPFLLPTAGLSLICGILVSALGYYYPFLLLSPILIAIGSGLLYTVTTSTNEAHLVGYQILIGVGTGMAMQNAMIVLQVEFKSTPRLLAQSMSLASFAQFLGGTLGLGIAEPVFSSTLTTAFARYAPNVPAALLALAREAPTEIYDAGVFPVQDVAGVVEAYTKSLRVVYLLGVPVAGISLIATLFIKNERYVKPGVPAANAKAKVDEEQGAQAVEAMDA
uniref:Major facilitator superfamily protein n=1 Tax=Mycena chlorophos TaxID=658473 RepID=A0ABQ0L746_MYCCL|nr:major facilitator superfamily protein [Mycena chlorophos]